MITTPRSVIVLHGVLSGGQRLQPLVVTPQEVDVELGDYRTADEWSCRLSFGRAPWDPRQVEAMGVDIYLGPAGPGGRLALDASTILLSGLVDEVAQEAASAGVGLKLRGRDFTALFLDHPWPRTVELGTLSETVAALVAEVPGADGMQVVLEGIPDVPLATGGRTRFTPQEGADTWTVITELCRRVGAVVFVRLNEIVIAGPRNLFPRDAAPTLLWGRDVEDLELRADLRARRRRAVVVFSLDPDTGAGVSATWPQQTGRLVVKANRRGAAEQPHLLEWYVPGIPAARLPDVARRVWEAQARGQVEGRIRTRRLWSVEEGAPLWQLRTASPVRLIAPSARAAANAGAGASTAVGNLVAAGMLEAVAVEFSAAAQALAAVDGPLYTTRARHHFSADDGYSVELDVQSYVTLEAP